MENATKALIIAGAVLVAILLLTLFAYVLSLMGEYTANVYDEMKAVDITEFNQIFLNYDDREISIQDVASIVNLAIDNNRSPKFSTEVIVDVTCGCETYSGDLNWAKQYKDNVNRILEEHIDDVKSNRKFSCKVEINPTTTVVNKVVIVRKE